MAQDRRPPPDIRFPFGNDLAAAREARRALRPILSDPEDVIAQDVELSASELVTNTVLHTHEGGVLSAWDPKPDVPLRLEVEDSSPTIPEPRDPATGPGGRGLRIVATVADEWGVERTPTGKVVWAEFDRRRRLHGSDHPDRTNGAEDGAHDSPPDGSGGAATQRSARELPAD